MSSAAVPTVSARGDPENPGGFRHVPALDGIRGLALLLVLFHHLFWANRNTGSHILDFINQVRGSAWIGVNLFFALSGFLITGILMDTVHRPRFFVDFYARRSLRIFPLYYGFLFLILVLTRPLHMHWNGWQIYFLTYTVNLAVFKHDAPFLSYFNLNHFWSLCVEEQFYIVWPFLVFRLKDASKLLRLSLILCVVALLLRVFFVLERSHFRSPYIPYSATYCCVDNLLLGCALSLALRTFLRDRILQAAPAAFALCATILIGFFIADHGLEWQTTLFLPTLGFSVLALMSASLVACALRPGSTIQHIFENAILRFFGKYSYGLYVFHYPLDNALSGPVRAFLRLHLHSKGLAVVGAALFVTAVSTVAALLSYHLYEVRFLKLKRYFGYARQVPGTPEAHAPQSV